MTENANTEPPILIFDTSALKNIGLNVDKPKFEQLLKCSINGHVNLHIPQVVITELGAQSQEEAFYFVTRSDKEQIEKEEAIDNIKRKMCEEERRLSLVVEKNGGTVVKTVDRYRRNAVQRINARTYKCERKKDKDRRDAIVYETVIDLAARMPEVKIVVAVSDGGPIDIINEYIAQNNGCSNIQVIKGDKIAKSFLNKFSDFPKNIENVTDEDLLPIDAPQFGNEGEQLPPSLEDFDMEAAQREMAERFKLSQKCLVAASHLMFPASSKGTVAEKIKLAWGIDPAETEGAAQYLMNEGHMEDLYGDYNVLNEDFAEQAIYALGDDINRLIEVLD